MWKYEDIKRDVNYIARGKSLGKAVASHTSNLRNNAYLFIYLEEVYRKKLIFTFILNIIFLLILSIAGKCCMIVICNSQYYLLVITSFFSKYNTLYNYKFYKFLSERLVQSFFHCLIPSNFVRRPKSLYVLMRNSRLFGFVRDSSAIRRPFSTFAGPASVFVSATSLPVLSMCFEQKSPAPPPNLLVPTRNTCWIINPSASLTRTQVSRWMTRSCDTRLRPVRLIATHSLLKASRQTVVGFDCRSYNGNALLLQ